jgi:predicted enzyme related to lactoylglutathione lyase
MAGFKALMTAIYPVPDLARAKAWYAQAFGVEPYFDEPFYVGFSVAGYELGLIPAEGEQQPGNAGVVAYWGTDDIDAMHARLLAAGATPVSPLQDVGGEVRVATVADPFGNAIGLIRNPQFAPPR